MVILMNFEVYEKDGVRKIDERIGIAVLRFSDEQILKDMENVIRAIEFYIGEYENTPGPLKRELEV
jgi:very-short-patch-repair endonuclease